MQQPCVPAQAEQHAAQAEPGPAAEWERWMRACRVGLRRPLGSDASRRRYWALGGRAGAFCVYFEEDEGRRWGWYEGAAPHLQPLAPPREGHVRQLSPGWSKPPPYVLSMPCCWS